MPTHQPVLVKEILELFQPKSGDRLLDATLGLGGHAKAYLEASGPHSQVVGLEADPQALAEAQQNLVQFSGRIQYLNVNFSQLKDSVIGGGILPAKQGQPPLFTHILFDLGVGSHQLADTKRGFSFTSPGRLTMRYGQGKLPAANVETLNMLERRLGTYPDALDIITGLSAEQLAEVIYVYGEERFSRRIAAAIKTAPKTPVTAEALAEVIKKAVPASYEHGRIHPATRTFQALRLAVNRELEALNAVLPQAVEVLAPEGMIAVLSFHSLEDRIVKHFFRERSRETLHIVTRKPTRASPEEIQSNPRARSAKLRAAVKK